MIPLIKEPFLFRLPVPASIYVALAGIIAGLATLRVDLNRRRLTLTRWTGWHMLTALDIASTALAVAIAAALLVMLIGFAIPDRLVSAHLSSAFGTVVSGAVFVFLWHEGLRQVQFQRPRGILFAEMLILAGVCAALSSILFRVLPGRITGPITAFLSISAILLGCGILFAIRSTV